MHLFVNIFKIRFLLVLSVFIGLASAVIQSAESLSELKLKWLFRTGSTLHYSVKQSTRIQNYLIDENDDRTGRSPIHVETVTGIFTLTSLPDNNAAGDLVLTLSGIEEEGRSLNVPAEQKIPQRVARFILTPEGSLEEYIGSRKETYLLTRLIFGLPIEGLKQNQVRVFPFKMFNRPDNSRIAFSGVISHELRRIDSTDSRKLATIVTTIDLRDTSPGEDLKDSIWKGIGTTVFDIETRQLEKTTFEIAVKKRFSRDDPSKILQTVEIFKVDIELMNSDIPSIPIQ